MKPYIGLVHKDGESTYGVAFPDAPGCFSAADSLDEIFVKAEEALRLWAENSTVDIGARPQTRDLSAIKADPDWAEAFATAALVIALSEPGGSMRNAA